MSTTTKKTGERYGCSICEKTFARKWNLKNHSRVHKQKRRQTKCPFCKSTFFDLPNVRQHFLKYHPKANFSESVSLLKWKNVVKKATADMPTCVLCRKSFTRHENLLSHMMRYHPNKQPRQNRQKSNKPDESERIFEKIKTNQYISTSQTILEKSMSTCDCSVNSNCGDDCLNRMCFYECKFGNCIENCTNNQIQKGIPNSIEVFITQEKGWGVKAKTNIDKDSFIIEYVGDVVKESELKKRNETLYLNDLHYYAIYLEAGFVIDARNKGNESRFINHSCSPNCVAQKWTVNGLPCIAIFALRDIIPKEELTIDYNFQLFENHEAKNCKCNANNCRKVIGTKV